MPMGFPAMHRGNMSGMNMQDLPLMLRYQQTRGGFGPSQFGAGVQDAMGGRQPNQGQGASGFFGNPSAPPPDPFQPGPPPQVSMAPAQPQAPQGGAGSPPMGGPNPPPFQRLIDKFTDMSGGVPGSIPITPTAAGPNAGQFADGSRDSAMMSVLGTMFGAPGMAAGMRSGGK
jgi:hypothetical protein